MVLVTLRHVNCLGQAARKEQHVCFDAMENTGDVWRRWPNIVSGAQGATTPIQCGSWFRKLLLSWRYYLQSRKCPDVHLTKSRALHGWNLTTGLQQLRVSGVHTIPTNNQSTIQRVMFGLKCHWDVLSETVTVTIRSILALLVTEGSHNTARLA